MELEGIGSLLSVGKVWRNLSKDFDINNESLRVTGFHDPPYITITEHANGSSSFAGFLVDLWETVADLADLHYHFIPAKEQGYGSQNENGIWNGMVAELAYGRADVALTWVYFRQDRESVVDYIDAAAVVESTTGFYTYGGSVDSLAFSVDMFASLLKPLHVNVWWTLLASLILLSMALRITLRFNCGRAEGGNKVEEFGWGTCLFSGFRSVLGQGWDMVPDSLAPRIVTIFTWALSIIIAVSYTANLISYLTVMTLEPPLSSLKEFSERPDWTLAAPPSYSVVNDWKTSKDVYERHLYQRVMHREGFISIDYPEETAHLTLKPKVLTYIDLETLKFSLESSVCSLIPLPNFPKRTLGAYLLIAEGKGSVKQRINKAMAKAKEAGIIARLREKYVPVQDMCIMSNDFKPLSFGNVLALILIMPLGFVASAAVLLGEKVFVLWRRSRIRKEHTSQWFSSMKSNIYEMKMR